MWTACHNSTFVDALQKHISTSILLQYSLIYIVVRAAAVRKSKQAKSSFALPEYYKHQAAMHLRRHIRLEDRHFPFLQTFLPFSHFVNTDIKLGLLRWVSG